MLTNVHVYLQLLAQVLTGQSLLLLQPALSQLHVANVAHSIMGPPFLYEKLGEGIRTRVAFIHVPVDGHHDYHYHCGVHKP